MFYAKVVLLIGICVVLFVTSEPPYFPIEISRCIASNTLSTVVFLCTVVASLICAYFTYPSLHKKHGILIAYNGLLFIGLFNDVDRWLMHMVGIGVMAAGIVIHIRGQKKMKQRNSIQHGIFVVVLYLFRIAVKVAAVSINELKFDSDRFGEIPTVAFKIMHTGVAKHSETIHEFAWGGGFIQWIAFFVLSFCL